MILVFAAVRQGLRLARREWQASLTFPIQSSPSAGFTLLEVEAIAAIGDASGCRQALIAHLASVEITLRWNTGSGCLVVLENAAPALSDVAILDTVAWFSLTDVPVPVGFRVWQSGGIVDLIEAFTDGYETSEIDWKRATFAAIKAAPERRDPALRPETGAWMKAEIDRAASSGLFEEGEVRLR